MNGSDTSFIDWFGRPPVHWNVERIKYSLEKIASRVGGEFPAGAISYGTVVEKNAEKISPETFATYQQVCKGEFLVNPINLNYDLVSLRTALSQKNVRVSSAYIVLRLKSDHLDSKFGEFALHVFDVRHMKTLGAGVRQTIKFEDIGNCFWTLPPLEEQREIGCYLDRETGRIDALIEEKGRFVALLREKRVAVVSHIVTKGLDPTAPTKPFGQDWLGDVPAHWDAVPANWLFQPSKELAWPDDILLSATQKYGVIPLADFEKLQGRKVTLAVANLDKRKHVEIGDFVISMRSMDGGIERARARGSVRSSYIVLKFSEEVDGRFYGYLLKSNLFIQALRLTANFVRDGQDMHFGHFRALKLPRLPLDEQARIADHLDRETTRIDALITETERSIALLREKRAAEITAAVTGQIDVGSAA